MFKRKKEIKIEIPITHKCVRCNESAKINSSRITLDDDLIAEYICDCGKLTYVRQYVRYI